MKRLVWRTLQVDDVSFERCSLHILSARNPLDLETASEKRLNMLLEYLKHPVPLASEYCQHKGVAPPECGTEGQCRYGIRVRLGPTHYN